LKIVFFYFTVKERVDYCDNFSMKKEWCQKCYWVFGFSFLVIVCWNNSICETKDRIQWQFFPGKKEWRETCFWYSLHVFVYWNNSLPEENKKKDTFLSSYFPTQRLFFILASFPDFCRFNLINSLFSTKTFYFLCRSFKKVHEATLSCYVWIL